MAQGPSGETLKRSTCFDVRTLNIILLKGMGITWVKLVR
jgi:hypothetical protein